ncbi:hypothetical protein LX64_05113 [Chitinophaga skermanii]|uniref:RloB-like protein n=1 Tax=Chitinophaga skermanii TaxID=331697 RepID=A0A327Q2L4_9BACT|nr:phage tail protein [Chitinophaga skermanii]RAI97442.1 hypothetical protein LX64_05113 [Chitinophaga skermanii]
MPTTFGIIAEGPTDQTVIQNILIGVFNNEDLNTNIRFIQPAFDKTTYAANSGGWTNVFEYIKSDRLIQAFEHNDYIIIQVDSDVCDQVHFDVRKTDVNGLKLSGEILIQKIIDRFHQLILEYHGEEKLVQMLPRLVFAICVQELECWLLPIYYTDKKASTTNNCVHRLNEKLDKHFIDKSNKSGMTHAYYKISKPYQKHKNIIAKYQLQPSLQHFVNQLLQIQA